MAIIAILAPTMKAFRYPGIFLFCLACAYTANAQSYDLDQLRAKPDSNALKIDVPPPSIRQIALPSSSLQLNIVYWRHWSSFGLNVNQASFSDNWIAGGVNSIAAGALVNHKSEYSKNNINFVSEVGLQYGQVKNRDQDARKSNDRIFWDNKLSLKFSPAWSLFASVTFETQFDDGFRYEAGPEGTDLLISSFMAPGYFTESFGLEYRPDPTFSLRLGTGTARQTLILDNRLVPGPGETRFGIESGRRFRNEIAFQLTANLDRNLTDNLNIKSRYNLFANYNELRDPVHRLDATLTARVTRLINVTLNGILIYDHDVDDRVQTSQTLAVGLLYKIP